MGCILVYEILFFDGGEAINGPYSSLHITVLSGSKRGVFVFFCRGPRVFCCINPGSVDFFVRSRSQVFELRLAVVETIGENVVAYHIVGGMHDLSVHTDHGALTVDPLFADRVPTAVGHLRVPSVLTQPCKIFLVDNDVPPPA